MKNNLLYLLLIKIYFIKSFFEEPNTTKVVLNRATKHAFTQSQAKLKLPFLQYLFLTLFLSKKEYCRNEDLSLTQFQWAQLLWMHFHWVILYTFTWFYAFSCDFRTLLHDPQLSSNLHSYNALFNHLFNQNDIIGNFGSERFCTLLYNLKHIYVIFIHSHNVPNTLIWSQAKHSFLFLTHSSFTDSYQTIVF